MVVILLLMFGVGTFLVIALTVFSDATRRCYVGWHAFWGITIDPESPFLKDESLGKQAYIIGVVYVFFLIIAFAMMYPHLN